MRLLQFRERCVRYVGYKPYGTFEFDPDVAAAITRANDRSTNYVFAFVILRTRISCSYS